MNLSNMAAGKLHHRALAAVSFVGLDEHSRPRRLCQSRGQPVAAGIAIVSNGRKTPLTGNAHWPARRFILPRELCDAAIEPSDRFVEVAQFAPPAAPTPRTLQPRLSRRRPRSAQPARERVWAPAPR